jgi:hypothetical protein
VANCPDAQLPDGDVCPRCGGPRAPSGIDGGSWVHVSTRPDRVVMDTYSYGKLVERKLANGVVLRPKVTNGL